MCKSLVVKSDLTCLIFSHCRNDSIGFSYTFTNSLVHLTNFWAPAMFQILSWMLEIQKEQIFWKYFEKFYSKAEKLDVWGERWGRLVSRKKDGESYSMYAHSGNQDKVRMTVTTTTMMMTTEVGKLTPWDNESRI